VVLREGVIVCVLDGANRLVRIDPATDEVTEARVPCESIGDGPLGTWVAAGGRVAQIDPASLQTIRVLRPPDLPGDADAAIAQAGGSLWVSRAGADSGGLFRVDPRSGQVVAHWTFTAANYTLAASAQTVYFTDPIADSVTAIDVATNQIERTAPVPGSDEGDPLLTYVDGQLWASTLTGGLALLDPASLRVIGTAQIDSQDYVGEVAVAGRYVWYPTYGGDAVVKVRRAALESD
jgi:streptogramin lyase